jgi:hypothetical protein
MKATLARLGIHNFGSVSGALPRYCLVTLRPKMTVILSVPTNQ